MTMIPSPKGKRITQNNAYHLFNLLIVVCVAMLFCYAWSDMRVLRCPYAEAGLPCRTCGLTTSFQSLLHGNGKHIVPGHVLLFLFFALQLVMRPLVSYLLCISTRTKLIRNVDLLVSVLMLGVAYWKLLVY